jgi:hypothetical protein
MSAASSLPPCRRRGQGVGKVGAPHGWAADSATRRRERISGTGMAQELIMAVLTPA